MMHTSVGARRKLNADLPMKVRRRQSDARWRANVASCYETLKNIIPINKRASKRQISKAMVLQETHKHINFLESILSSLLCEKANCMVVDDPIQYCEDEISKIKGEFLETEREHHNMPSYAHGIGRYRRTKMKYVSNHDGNPTDPDKHADFEGPDTPHIDVHANSKDRPQTAVDVPAPERYLPTELDTVDKGLQSEARDTEKDNTQKHTKHSEIHPSDYSVSDRSDDKENTAPPPLHQAGFFSTALAGAAAQAKEDMNNQKVIIIKPKSSTHHAQPTNIAAKPSCPPVELPILRELPKILPNPGKPTESLPYQRLNTILAETRKTQGSKPQRRQPQKAIMYQNNKAKTLNEPRAKAKAMLNLRYLTETGPEKSYTQDAMHAMGHSKKSQKPVPCPCLSCNPLRNPRGRPRIISASRYSVNSSAYSKGQIRISSCETNSNKAVHAPKEAAVTAVGEITVMKNKQLTANGEGDKKLADANCLPNNQPRVRSQSGSGFTPVKLPPWLQEATAVELPPQNMPTSPGSMSNSNTTESEPVLLTEVPINKASLLCDEPMWMSDDDDLTYPFTLFKSYSKKKQITPLYDERYDNKSCLSASSLKRKRIGERTLFAPMDSAHDTSLENSVKRKKPNHPRCRRSLEYSMPITEDIGVPTSEENTRKCLTGSDFDGYMLFYKQMLPLLEGCNLDEGDFSLEGTGPVKVEKDLSSSENETESANLEKPSTSGSDYLSRAIYGMWCDMTTDQRQTMIQLAIAENSAAEPAHLGNDLSDDLRLLEVQPLNQKPVEPQIGLVGEPQVAYPRPDNLVVLNDISNKSIPVKYLQQTNTITNSHIDEGAFIMPGEKYNRECIRKVLTISLKGESRPNTSCCDPKSDSDENNMKNITNTENIRPQNTIFPRQPSTSMVETNTMTSKPPKTSVTSAQQRTLQVIPVSIQSNKKNMSVVIKTKTGQFLVDQGFGLKPLLILGQDLK